MEYQHLQAVKKDMRKAARAMVDEQEKYLMLYKRWLLRGGGVVLMGLAVLIYGIVHYNRNDGSLLVISFGTIVPATVLSSLLYKNIVNCKAKASFWRQIELQICTCVNEQELAAFRVCALEGYSLKMNAKKVKEVLSII